MKFKPSVAITSIFLNRWEKLGCLIKEKKIKLVTTVFEEIKL